MNQREGTGHEECRSMRRGCVRAAQIFAVFVLVVMAPDPRAFAERLTTLATPPEWTLLEPFQETITRDEFTRLLHEVYAPNNAAQGMIDLHGDHAAIHRTLQPPDIWTLRFAPHPQQAKPVPRFWRAPSELGPAPDDQPLLGAKIAIDAGHIGGSWARMEERWFQIGDGTPVAEGEMTLQVAELLAPKLRRLGADVSMVRQATAPTTRARPTMLREAARAELAAQGDPAPPETYDSWNDPRRGRTVQYQSELLFYRAAEIRHRGDSVNRLLKPDLTICLHFNAEPWGDPKIPKLSQRNHFHVLVNGSYSAAELRNDDVRFEMLLKLLQRSSPAEIAVSENVAATVAQATGLPPYVYSTSNARRVGQSPFVWARNLLASRVYQTPVVFLEPYVMNSEEVWQRVQAGDYEGERLVAGRLRKSIQREYADAVAEGIRSYFSAARK